MFKWVAALSLTAALCGLGRITPARAQARLTVVADPGPFASVDRAASAERRVDWRDEDPRDDRACTEAFAATELRHWLSASAPRGLRVGLEGRIPGDGDVVLVGSNLSLAASLGLDTLSAPPFASADEECFRLFRARMGARRVWVVQGRGRAGTLYGAYAFLERLGWRWNGLGLDHAIPPRGDVRLPDTLVVSESPAFLSRGFWAFEPRGTAELMIWMARHRLNLWTDRDTALVPLARKLAIRLVGGGHDIQAVCLDPRSRTGARTLFEAHPDWFGLHNGRRSADVGPEKGDNFCTSNDAAVRALCDALIRELDHGRWRDADELAFWMHDNGRWCECGPCTALGSPTDRLLRLMGQVGDALGEARSNGALRRKVLVSSLAFLETLEPPIRARTRTGDDLVMTWFPIDRCYAHGLSDSSCTEINQDLDATFRRWVTPGSASPRVAMGVGEYYNVSDIRSFPMVLTRVIGEDARYYHASGVRHFHFMHVLHRDWGPWAIDYVLLARLLWNPSERVPSLRGAFITETYPTTAALMDTFYAALEVASANVKLLKGRVAVGPSSYQLARQIRLHLEPLPLEHMALRTMERTRNVAPDLDRTLAAMRLAARTLATARARARDPGEAARLAALQRRFDYGDAMLGFYADLIQAYIADELHDAPSAVASVTAMTRDGERLRRMVDVVQVSSAHANAANGLEATGLVPVYQDLRRKYGR